MASLVYSIVSWPLWLNALAIIVFATTISWFAVRLVRGVWPYPAFKENNELVGFTYAVYGLIYGVLLAFIIVVAWQRFAETEQLVMQEAVILSELWRDSLAFPPAFRDNIHNDLIEYTQSVIYDEWPTMSAAGKAHPHTQEVYERLWALTYHIEPKSESQGVFLGEFLARMNELSGTRRLRILHSRMDVHGVLWMVLLIGAVPTVAYTLLFSNKHAIVQFAIMGSIMTIVMLGLLVTLYLQHAFSSAAGIQPDVLLDLLRSFEHRLRAESVSVGP